METGYRDLCSRCFNSEVTSDGGLAFEQFNFLPMEMSGPAGVKHTFHFRLLHLGDRMALEAFEVGDGDRTGYDFQILGDGEDDPFELMVQLVQRIRRAVGQRDLLDEGVRCSIAGKVVRAKISCDLESQDRAPMLVIDGREISWDQFGQMLMTFEGWQFKLEIKDPSEEV
jgi:hypothetical protein